MPTSLSPEQVRLVLRRAAELEKRRDPDSEATAETEVAEIAAEVGIEASAVKLALADLHAGVIKTEEDVTFLDRLVGPLEVTASRTVPGTVTEVRAAVARFLQTQLMQVKRNLGERGQIWEPSADFWSGVRRAFSLGQRVAFEKGTEVSVSVVPNPGYENEVIVRITARHLEPRRRRAWQAAAGAASGVAMAGVGIAAFHTVGPEVASILVGAGTAAGSLAAVRAGHKRDLSTSEQAILRFLDSLEHGEPEPPTPKASLQRFLQRFTQ